MSEAREVFDGWTYWRIRLVESPSRWRRRPGWRYLTESKFTSWEPRGLSRWFATKEACEEAAHRHLEAKEWPDGPLLTERIRGSE